MEAILPESSVLHQVGAFDAQPGREHAVEDRRAAAALHVAEHDRTGFDADALLDLLRDEFARRRARAG